MTDIRQSKGYAKYLKSQGWITERKNGINYFLKKVPFLGYTLKIQRPKTIDYQYIDVLVLKYKPWQISIEPLEPINGYKLSKSPFLPTKTLQIDLTKSVKQITADFHYRARRGLTRGSKVMTKIYSTSNDIKIFQNAWQKSVNLSRNVLSVNQLLSIKKSYQQKDTLLLASHNINSRVIGGALFTISRKMNDIVCYYWSGFTNKEGRSLLSQYSLMYKGILWAKKRGCKVFDFEGIYDDRFPNKSWLGFTHFKKSFGGYEVEYPGCYVKYDFMSILTRLLHMRSQ